MRIWWIVAWTIGCASAPPPAPEFAPPAFTAPEPEPDPPPPFECPASRGLCFRVVPPSAELTVNDDTHGRLDEIGQDGQLFLELAAGIYQVTLRAPEYETWRGEVSVQDQTEMIEVTLTPRE